MEDKSNTSMLWFVVVSSSSSRSSSQVRWTFLLLLLCFLDAGFFLFYRYGPTYKVLL